MALKLIIPWRPVALTWLEGTQLLESTGVRPSLEEKQAGWEDAHESQIRQLFLAQAACQLHLREGEVEKNPLDLLKKKSLQVS